MEHEANCVLDMRARFGPLEDSRREALRQQEMMRWLEIKKMSKNVKSRKNTKFCVLKCIHNKHSLNKRTHRLLLQEKKTVTSRTQSQIPTNIIGTRVSTTSISFENLLKILPTGVVSKMLQGALISLFNINMNKNFEARNDQIYGTEL